MLGRALQAIVKVSVDKKKDFVELLARALQANVKVSMDKKGLS